jgi:DnaK suppressor protein
MARIATGRVNKMDQERNYSRLRKTLLAQKQELAARISERLGDVVSAREPDDIGGIASENSTKDLAVATLERERRTLKEIEAALERLRARQYGVCEACGASIPKVRLEALPWARLCLNCAERTAAA